MLYTRLKKEVTLFAVVLLIGGSALAAGNGSNPKGKPFVELQGQIIEVQNDISTLEAAYDVIVARIEALEIADEDLAARIVAINGEIAALQAADTAMLESIDALAEQAAQQGVDIDILLDDYFQIIGELADLQAATGDNSVAIASLQTDLTAALDAIAANADGLATALTGFEENAELIAMLQGDIDDLQVAIDASQDDITGACPAGAAVTTVNDDGTLVCGFANGIGEIVSAQVYSPSRDLDRYFTYFNHYHGFGSYHRHYYWVSGSGSARAHCPAGYKVSGGGFHLNDRNTGNVRVRTSQASGDSRWYVYFDNLSGSSTSGYSGRAYASCVKAD